MKRRHLEAVAGAGLAGGAAGYYRPRQGWLDPCWALPSALVEHDLVRAAGAGIEARYAAAHYPLRFYFVLKRSIILDGVRLPMRVFETRSFFERVSHVSTPS